MSKGIACEVGARLEVQDGNTWYPACVVEVGDGQVRVRIDDWKGESACRWEGLASRKLRQLGSSRGRIDWLDKPNLGNSGASARPISGTVSAHNAGAGAAGVLGDAGGQVVRTSPRLNRVSAHYARQPVAAAIRAGASRLSNALEAPVQHATKRQSTGGMRGNSYQHSSPASAGTFSARRSSTQEKEWVGRQSQIRLLTEVVCGPPRTAVFVHGPPATGKSEALDSVLDGWYDGWPPMVRGVVVKHQIIKIDCAECSSLRALLDTILNQLPRVHSTVTASGTAGSASTVGRRTGGTAWIRADRGIPQMLDALRNVCYKQGYRITMIFDRAERLRQLEPRFLSSLLRLNELLDSGNDQRGLSQFATHVCGTDDLFEPEQIDTGVLVVLVSENEWRTFRDTTSYGTGMIEPVIVPFPAYTKEELIKILEKLWFHSDAPSRPDHLRTEESRILPDFLRLMIEVLYPVCRDLLELQRLLREMLPKAAAQMKHEMQQAKNSEGGIMPELHSVARPILGEAQKHFYSIGAVGCTAGSIAAHSGGTRSAGAGDTQFDSTAATSMLADRSVRSSTVFDLPLYTKYLLVAAYLASHVAAKHDKLLFTRFGMKKNRKRRRGTADKPLSHVLPEAFPVERCIAIFQALQGIGEGADAHKGAGALDLRGTEMLTQIQCLVQLRLLVNASSGALSLDSCKLKCNVDHSTIEQLAKGFKPAVELRSYFSSQ